METGEQMTMTKTELLAFILETNRLMRNPGYNRGEVMNRIVYALRQMAEMEPQPLYTQDAI
jgi:hypothetical protein